MGGGLHSRLTAGQVHLLQASHWPGSYTSHCTLARFMNFRVYSGWLMYFRVFSGQVFLLQRLQWPSPYTLHCTMARIGQFRVFSGQVHFLQREYWPVIYSPECTVASIYSFKCASARLINFFWALVWLILKAYQIMDSI